MKQQTCNTLSGRAPVTPHRFDVLAAGMASAVTRREALVRGAGIVGGILVGLLGFGARKVQAFPYATCLAICRGYTNLAQRQRCLANCQNCTTVMCSGVCCPANALCTGGVCRVCTTVICNGVCCPANTVCLNGVCAAVCTVGGTCAGGFGNFANCPGRPNRPDCLCGSTTEGTVRCFVTGSYPPSSCTSSAGCPPGSICLTNNCCGYSACAQLC
jgi:hypothetical protein